MSGPARTPHMLKTMLRGPRPQDLKFPDSLFFCGGVLGVKMLAVGLLGFIEVRVVYRG